ncbi:unnamed protein product [Laminaria digitata]
MTVLQLMSFLDIDVSASSLFSSFRVETWTEGASGQIQTRPLYRGFRKLLFATSNTSNLNYCWLVVVGGGGGGFVVLRINSSPKSSPWSQDRLQTFWSVTEKAKPGKKLIAVAVAVATAKRIRANRFRQFCRRKRVLGGICDRIIRPPQFESDERDVVVAYGDGTFVSRGRFPGPVKTLRREIEKRVGGGEGPVGVSYRAVNEDYTSQLCSECKEVLEPMLDKEHKPIHAVRRCPTTSCVRRLWNRDVNACRNIYAIFVHENSNQGSRPEKFTRAYQRAQRAAVT